MPRKSKDLDKKMIKVGIDLMVKKGVSGVSVRMSVVSVEFL